MLDEYQLQIIKSVLTFYLKKSKGACCCCFPEDNWKGNLHS